MLGIKAKINKSPLHSAPGSPHLSIMRAKGCSRAQGFGRQTRSSFGAGSGSVWPNSHGKLLRLVGMGGIPEAGKHSWRNPAAGFIGRPDGSILLMHTGLLV